MSHPLQVTVVTLYDGSLVEHYVGAVDGIRTVEEMRELASRYGATLEDDVQYDDDEIEEDERILYWRVVDLVKEPNNLLAVHNISSTTPTVVKPD